MYEDHVTGLTGGEAELRRAAAAETLHGAQCRWHKKLKDILQILLTGIQD